MEKRISYSQFQQVKSAAKMIDPLQRKMQPLRKTIEGLVAELKSYQTQVDALEAGIVSILGFHVSDLVKKVIEPTGKTDANGKPLTVTKYLPTDIVRYDETSREYVITVPDEQPEAGSDFDNDAASFRADETTDAEINPSEGDEVSEVADELANGQESKDEMPWE